MFPAAPVTNTVRRTLPGAHANAPACVAVNESAMRWTSASYRYAASPPARSPILLAARGGGSPQRRGDAEKDWSAKDAKEREGNGKNSNRLDLPSRPFASFAD